MITKANPLNINLNEFPQELYSYFQNTNVYDSSCSKDATVLYINSGYYLKISDKDSLKNEYLNTKWFNSKGLSAEVIKYISFNNKDYLLTKEAPGKTCLHFLNEPIQLCKALASILHKIHSLPIEDFPVKTRIDDYILLAETNYNKSLYDDHVLLPRFNINSREEAWELVQKNKHKLKRDTVIHGDFCLPNILLNEKLELSAIIDVGNAGIGDKHIDLFWAVWSLNYNLKTDKYTECFLNAYGKDNFDYEMLRVIAAFEVFG